MSRDLALKAVYEENMPRIQSMKWYFDRIGVDMDYVINAVERMPKLYK